MANPIDPAVGVRPLAATSGSWAYLVLGPPTVLIDTGFPGRGPAILDECDRLGARPSHIVVTHYDVDHVGNLAWLEEATGADVWLPRDDAPYVLGERVRPGVKRWIAAVVRCPPPKRWRLVADGDRVAGLVALATPGHTPGHWTYAGAGFLAVGDAVVRRRGAPRAAGGWLDWDRRLAAETARRLLADPKPRWLLPAHGEPFRWPG
jgi:glyoxylase-like metal-dependent hydrolase (beta-lactamase superfamily II)